MSRAVLLTLALAALPLTSRAASTAVDLSAETPGAEPRAMLPIVGNWSVAEEGGRKVLKVDGTRWQQGQSGANLADKARTIYGERYAEFLDSVKAFAYFPYAVARDVPDFREGEISMRFKPLAGRVDQAGGILFDLKPNGDYLALRANALEHNLVLWRVVKGKRSSVKWSRHAHHERPVARPEGRRPRPVRGGLPRRETGARAHPRAARQRARRDSGPRRTASAFSMPSPFGEARFVGASSGR